MSAIEIEESKLSRFLFGNTRLSILWLIIRVYIGYQWIIAGWSKLGNPMWLGENSGVAIKNFLVHALGQNPNMSDWFSYFVQSVVLKHPVVFSYLVVYGEIIVGVTLILGLLTGIAAAFGMFMNINYLFAGAISINPTMIVLEIILLLAWRTAGWIGFDRYLLPSFGVSWMTEPIIRKQNKPSFKNTIQ